MRKEYDFSKAKLVVPPRDRRKTRITIRLDTKVLNWFRQRVHEAGGGNYQTMINEALKCYIKCYDPKSKDISLRMDPKSSATQPSDEVTKWMRAITQIVTLTHEKVDLTHKSVESLREQQAETAEGSSYFEAIETRSLESNEQLH